MEKVAEKSTMNVNRHRSFRIELAKRMYNINPAFMNEVFELRKTNRAIPNQHKFNQQVPIINQVTFAAKSIRYLVPKIANSLPFHIKTRESLTTFKRIIKDGDMVSSECPIFKSRVLLLK